jgi:hypothetical protein
MLAATGMAKEICDLFLTSPVTSMPIGGTVQSFHPDRRTPMRRNGDSPETFRSVHMFILLAGIAFIGFAMMARR